MHNVSSLRGNSHSAFGQLASIGFVRDGIALGVYLSQGIIYKVIDFQFEDIDVVLGLG